jgi:prephenate dehydrogenase
MKPLDSVAILGVGLIGGSIGLALRKRKLAGKVIGLGRNSSRLGSARRRGAVTATSTRWATGVSGVEMVVVCTPVGQIVKHVLELAENCNRPTLITDVGSTKQHIVESLAGKLPTHVQFVGSHPMSGSEKTGVQYSRDDLFEGRVAIVTPGPDTQKESLKSICRFWEALGSRVITMTPDLHDQAVGAVSHLPHVAATVLAAMTRGQDQPLAASGWMDTTRVAAGDPRLWQQIFEENKDHVLDSIDQFSELLGQFRDALAKDDRRTVSRILKAGKRNRDALGS